MTKHMLLHHFLEKSAAEYPDKIAIIDDHQRMTYCRVNAQAELLAQCLQSNGVEKGGRVVILLENGVEYVVAYFAVLKAGAVAVPMSTEIKPDGLNPLLAELEPAAIISSFRFERVLAVSQITMPSLKLLVLSNPKKSWQNLSIQTISWQDIMNKPCGPQTRNCPEIDSADLASIIYTSGSTGKPKGVMLSHGNLVANTISICQYQQLSSEDIQMVVLPFFYVMGKSLLNTLVAVGGTLVINNKFAFPASVINQMVEEKVTLFSGVPSTYAYLLHRSPLVKNRDRLEHLRMVTQAGGHMARSIKTDLRKALPDHTQICIMYGATEGSARLAWLDPSQFTQYMDSIGRAIPGVEIKILDRAGNELPDGEVGELVAYGPNIMQGYWKDPQATAKVLDQNGYHTGDMGLKNPQGLLFLQGRQDSLLKVGGHRINPQEVEDALLATGKVMETAVVGIPDDLLGMRLAALVVPLAGEDSKEAILHQCSKLLPKYKLPGEVRIVRAVPKNANGKIDRNRCLGILSEAK